jgi:hypothetical protein
VKDWIRFNGDNEWTIRARKVKLCIKIDYKLTVAYLLKVGTAEPEKQPLLANDPETTFVSRQRLGKHVPTARMHMWQYKYCWKRCFLLGPCKGVIRKITGATESVLYRSLWRKEAVGREPPFRKDLSAEAEGFPLLEAVARERLVKTQQAGKDLASHQAKPRV